MNRFYFSLLTLLLFSFNSISAFSQTANITSHLQQEIARADGDEQIRINIRLAEQFDIKSVEQLRHSMNPGQVRDFVVDELKQFSSQSQHDLLGQLAKFQQKNQVSHVTPLWITNVINCYATPAAIAELANRKDIERIDFDEVRILIDPVEIIEVAASSSKEITYNVNIMNVPQVWDLGFTGEGIVVAVLDTGVNYNHLDLNGNMWEHPEFPFHGWNFVDQNNNPMDYHGHGTHCAGTVSGNGNSGSQTGMAPGAKIMALQVLGAGGGGTESGVWQAIQFSVEYGAHIMSLSLGWRHIWGPDRASWRDAMNNALAAGVVAAVAAGNEGGGAIPSNVRTPGDVPSPWQHPLHPGEGGRSAVISIGATDGSDLIAGFSSRGPVTWQNVNPYNDYPFNPGIGLIRPDVVAPGVDVKSLAHFNVTGYTTMSGTSMACPGAAGVMALVLSKNPSLSPEELNQILEETATPLSAQKNNTYGSGRLNALAAVNATNFPGPVYHSHIINDTEGNANGLVNAYEYISLDMILVNGSNQSYSNIVGNISTTSPHITLINATFDAGEIPAGASVEITDAVRFVTAANIPGGHYIHFIVETTDGNESWSKSFSVMAHAPNILISSMVVGNSQLISGEEATFTFSITSNGQEDAINPTALITAQTPYLTIHNPVFEFETMAPGTSQEITVSASIAPGLPQGAGIYFKCDVNYENFSATKLFADKVGTTIEDFETGDLNNYNWTTAGHQPWEITEVNPGQGVFSARSGSISHNQMSVLSLQLEVFADDSISFYRRVSSEAQNDFLRFTINNIKVDDWSGEVGWSRVSYALAPGVYNFSWIYRKNNMLSSGEDAAWIDYISFPLSLATTVWVSNDTLVCDVENLQLNGWADHYDSIMWSATGSGSFSDANILNPAYTPGADDYFSDEVFLILTAYRDGEAFSDSLHLMARKTPDAPVKPSGPNSIDLHKVSESVYYIDMIDDAEEFEWMLEPQAAGELVMNATQLTINWNTNYLGNAMLSAKAINTCGSSDASPMLEIELFNSVGINELQSGKLVVFPNPSTDLFFVEALLFPQGEALLSIHHPDGKMVYNEALQLSGTELKHALNLSDLQGGIYLLSLSGDNFRYVTRIVIIR